MRSTIANVELTTLAFLFLACAAPAGCTSTREPDAVAESKALSTECHDTRTELVLPGPTFYPESIDRTPDGTFYVGSMGTGAVVRVPPGATNAEPFVASQNGLLTLGVLADVAKHALWTCVYDTTKTPPAQQPSSVRGYDLTTGSRIASYDMPGNADSFCNGLALDDYGNLYATDSAVNTIVKLSPGASALETWATNPLFAPAPGSASNLPTLNDMAFDRLRHRLIVTKSDSNQLLSVPFQFDGQPGDVSVINLDSPVLFPDGVSMVDEDTLVVAEHVAGNVVVVELSNDGTQGTRQVIASNLREPTASSIYHGSAWVTVSQERFFDGQPGSPSLPFLVQRFALP